MLRVDPDASWLPPCDPTAFYCVGRNFAGTLDQQAYDRPGQPAFFIKPPPAPLAHEAPIRYSSFTDELTCADELAAVIDEECTALDPADVPGVVRRYTVMNDLDALDQPRRTAREVFDGSAPLSPWIETEREPQDPACGPA